jgi:Flp pilus assembly protein TadD
MYNRALAGREKALGPDHTSTLNTVHNLGVLYKNQGRLADAERMYNRALAGCEKVLGPDHKSTLDIVHNLGILYSKQGRLADAERMFNRASTHHLLSAPMP